MAALVSWSGTPAQRASRFSVPHQNWEATKFEVHAAARDQCSDDPRSNRMPGWVLKSPWKTGQNADQPVFVYGISSNFQDSFQW